MEEEDAPLTLEEKFEYWQLCRIAIDYKKHAVSKIQAIEEFAAWSEMPKGVAWMLLDSMRKMTLPELQKAFPDWINKRDEPKFRDATFGVRRDKFAKKALPRGTYCPKNQAASP